MIEQSLLTTDLTQDYFALFGLTPAFDINIKALETRFREIQSASHPDRFVTASASENARLCNWLPWQIPRIKP